MAPKANVVHVVPDGYVLMWNYFGAEPVPFVIPLPVPAAPPASAAGIAPNVVQVVPDGYALIWNYFGAEPVPVVIPMPVPAAPPPPAAVSIFLNYWWEHGFFSCGDNLAHDDVNVQWQEFYSQYRS